MSRKDFALLVVIAALFGASFLFIRIAAPVTGPFPVSGGRVALGALVPLAVLAWRGGLGDLFGGGSTRARDLLVVGVLLAALPFTLFAVAELRVTASLASVLNAAVPLWSVLVAAVWLGQPVTARRLGGALIGVTGVAMAVGLGPLPRDPVTLAAAGACLVAAFSYAMGSVWTARRLADVPPTALAAGQQLTAAVVLAGPAVLAVTVLGAGDGRPPEGTAGAVAAIAALGVVCTGIAFTLWFRLLRSVGPVAAVTVTLLAPVFGVAWGALFLDEPVTPGLVVGAAGVLLGVSLITGTSLRPGLRPRARQLAR